MAGVKNEAAGEAIRAAMRALDLGDGVAVIASPHGRTTGVYARVTGDLGAFGRPDVAASASSNDGFAHALADAWGRPLLDGPADYGVVVPLRLLGAREVVAVAFEEGSADPSGLAEALLALGRPFAFVASANLSPGVGGRGPLPLLDGSDEEVLASLKDSPERVSVPEGSCAAAPLAVFGALFARRSCEVLAYDHPFGVGHAVAVTR